jgi:hypothetical protein
MISYNHREASLSDEEIENKSKNIMIKRTGSRISNGKQACKVN